MISLNLDTCSHSLEWFLNSLSHINDALTIVEAGSCDRPAGLVLTSFTATGPGTLECSALKTNVLVITIIFSR